MTSRLIEKQTLNLVPLHSSNRTQADFVEYVSGLPFCEEEKHKLLWDNAPELLGLE